METLGAIYVIVTSLIGTSLIISLALIASMDIWVKIQERSAINKMDRKFHDTPTG